jgi:aminomethyltransferase
MENGLLSHGSDMTLETNPFEVGLGKYCDLDQDVDFIGKAALKRIKAEGIKQQLVGIVIPDAEIKSMMSWMPLTDGAGENAGNLTSLTYSLRLQKTIAYGLVPMAYTAVGTALVAHLPEGKMPAIVHEMPFIK